MTHTVKYLIQIISFLVICVSFQACAKWYLHTFDTMGTRAHLEFWLDEESTTIGHAEKLISQVMMEMDRLDKSMSPYITSSELSLLNRDAGNRPVSVSIELISLLAIAQDISVMSEGAFDITYASIGYQYDYRENIRPASIISLMILTSFIKVPIPDFS